MAKELQPTNQAPPLTELNACVSTSNGRRAVKKDTTCREWFLHNQIGISLTLMAMLLAVHNLYPSLKPYTASFFQLSHKQPSGVYTQGWDDVYFVAGVMVGFTAIRAICIEWILQPAAMQLGLKRKASIRFAEQGWQVIYYLGFWLYGMYLWSNSKYWFNFPALWSDWPSRDISGTFKLYCLMQLGFWVQQILVINIEERRKDHYQMLTHHVVTITLLGSAYVYSFYNVSNVVLCIMDIVDLLLPAAKILKYTGCEIACNVAFGVFLLVWFLSRHVVYNMLWWSIYKSVPENMAYGCYSGATGEMLTTDAYPDNWGHLLYPFQDINGPICMNRRVKWIFLSFLLFLQILSLVWFTMIVRIAISFVRTGNAEDTRSDDEAEVEDEVELTAENHSNGTPRPIAVETTSAEGGWKRSVVSSGPSQGSSVRIRRGRVRLSDQSDRKALLGRIGCDKPT